MAKIGQIRLWTKCGKPLKASKFKGFVNTRGIDFGVEEDFNFLLANAIQLKNKVTQIFLWIMKDFC